jgi:serine/threonine-protein kinase HipA
MRKAKVFVLGELAGFLTEVEKGGNYHFAYLENYDGPPVSLTLPVGGEEYDFDRFPSFFEGLLPEGFQLEGLLRVGKIDKDDLFGQLIVVGEDLVGAVTVEEEA